MTEHDNYYNKAVPVIKTALVDCEEIDEKVCEDPKFGDPDQLPEDAGRFVEDVRPKLVSVQEYAKANMRVSYKQWRMVESIAAALERWLQR